MDDSVRAMSTRGQVFLWDEHDAWYRGKLEDGLNRIWIMEVSEIPVGQIRYGRVPNDSLAETAIAISPSHWGNGYASDLLTTTLPWAQQWLGVSRMVALVLVGNLRSKFLFERAGFRYVGDEQRMGKDHWRYEKEMT